MQALRSVREHFRPSAQQEQRKNFAPYSKHSTSSKWRPASKKLKTQTWTCKAVCLAGKNDDLVPVTPSLKLALLEAGLGEKKVRVEDVTCSKEEFIACIVKHFLKLKECGGFEVLRCLPNSKTLEVVPSNVAFSPSLLKTVIGAGRIFLRPIQIDLDISPQHSDKQESVVSSVWVCGCVCGCLHVRVCICACMYICVCVCVCVCVWVRGVHVGVDVLVSEGVCMCVCIHTCACMHVCVFEHVMGIVLCFFGGVVCVCVCVCVVGGSCVCVDDYILCNLTGYE